MIDPPETPPPPPSGGGWAALNSLGSFIPGLGQIISQNVAHRQARENTDRSFQLNKQLADYQYSKDLDLWNRANAYNAPAAQMQRLKAAGLNPNLVYGHGADAGSVGTLPKYQAPQVNYQVPPEGSAGELLQSFALGNYQDFRLKQAQIDNLRAERRSKEQATANAATMGKILGERLPGETYKAQMAQEQWKRMFNTTDKWIATELLKLQLGQDLMPYQLDSAKLNVDKLNASIGSLVQGMSESRERVLSLRQGRRESDSRIKSQEQSRAESLSRVRINKMRLGYMGQQIDLMDSAVQLNQKQKELRELDIDNYLTKMYADMVFKGIGSAEDIARIIYGRGAIGKGGRGAKDVPPKVNQRPGARRPGESYNQWLERVNPDAKK